ncbi:MAG: hypothetical protein ACTSPI_00865 [Candidatus Heimdallarchaeaceae archaeon]
MNKLGVVHSGYHPIIPLGNRICLRMMLDDYNKGNFLARRRCDYDDWAKYVYLDMRTYKQQIEDAIKSDPKEIFLVIDPRGCDVKGMIDFTAFLKDYFRLAGYSGELIFSFVNESLERFSVSEVHNINRYMSTFMKSWYNVSLAVGEMACNFFDYYRSFLRCDYSYDYISFHTDNACNVRTLRHFLEIFPGGTKFINNKHCFFYGSEKLGYNNLSIVRQFESYTKYMLSNGRIKSIYVCMPYHTKGAGKYEFLGLNLVDTKSGKVYETVAWKVLKRYE